MIHTLSQGKFRYKRRKFHPGQKNKKEIIAVLENAAISPKNLSPSPKKLCKNIPLKNPLSGVIVIEKRKEGRIKS